MTPLPWFAFDREAYLRDTMHLTTEEHGAYLLLMLAYYGTGKPLPGYDRALASITKLTLERWGIVKVGLEPLFVVEEGVWKHKRIERELLEASSKHAKAVAKATAAAAARHGKTPSEHASSMPQAPNKPARGTKPAPSQPEASSEHAPSKPEASSSSPHLHLHKTLSSERVLAREDAQGTLARQDQASLGEGKQANPLGDTLSETWVPSSADQQTAAAYGLQPFDIEHEVLTFHAYHAQNGTFSKNWSATWQMWCARWKERQQSKPQPRLEVSTKPYEPSTEDWRKGLSRFAKNQSSWSHKTLGPEPGQSGCRCPRELMLAANIDPKTGIYRQPAKEASSV